jgi:hypothetical protein
MARNNFDIKTYLQENSLPLLLQAVGLIVIIANLYLANKLAPMAKDISSIIDRVEAIETDRNENSKYVERFIKAETDIQYIKETVVDIKRTLEIHLTH